MYRVVNKLKESRLEKCMRDILLFRMLTALWFMCFVDGQFHACAHCKSVDHNNRKMPERREGKLAQRRQRRIQSIGRARDKLVKGSFRMGNVVSIKQKKISYILVVILKYIKFWCYFIFETFNIIMSPLGLLHFKKDTTSCLSDKDH